MTEPTPHNEHFPLSFIHPTARIHPSAQVGPFCTLGAGVDIGEHTQIGPRVTIEEGVKIGKGCFIAANTVINSDTRQLETWPNPQMYASSRKYIITIGDGVHIEPSATLHGEITIGDNCWIGSNVTIYDGARIGNAVRIFPGAVISGIPQDLKFTGERTTLEIGDNTTIRECATLNRGTSYHGRTAIGKNCLIMAYVHVAHDCLIGDHVILANTVNMAGHVEVEDYAIIGGVSAIHQFVKIGAHVMVSGGSKIGKDVPPFIKVGREPLRYEGINSIGLRRRGFDAGIINQLQDIYRYLFLSGMNNTQAINYIETHVAYSEERQAVVNFVRNSDRGIIRGHRSHSSNGHSRKVVEPEA